MQDPETPRFINGKEYLPKIDKTLRQFDENTLAEEAYWSIKKY